MQNVTTISKDVLITIPVVEKPRPRYAVKMTQPFFIENKDRTIKRGSTGDYLLLDDRDNKIILTPQEFKRNYVRQEVDERKQIEWKPRSIWDV